MKRVVCLYRVSTVGQVDHDDIPMQKIACREYAQTHPDWEIVREVSEKGISGYKVSSNDRDAIIEIKKMAMAKQFDILLVFMFDRIGRRDDETPFVVQWFVSQGIEVWSTREGEQRFDSHVDKLLNYIRYWQASGESEKTSMRVRTKHSQMVMDGQYRGGTIPYGYTLVHKGRTNKKNQPMRDLAINEGEARVIRQIYHLIVDEGYGTNRTAKWLNDNGIPTKRNKTFWRGTAIKAIIENPVYKGVLHFGDEYSEPFEELRIVDDDLFDRCVETVHSRAPKKAADRTIPIRTDHRGLLTGIIYCAHCGQRLTYSHITEKKHLANGGISVHERDMYRCYRKVSNRQSCNGQTVYCADKIESPILRSVEAYFDNLMSIASTDALEMASARKCSVFEKAYNEARDAYDTAFREMHVLEEEAMKTLTGKGHLDISMINSMLPRYRSRLEDAEKAMIEAQQRLEQERTESSMAIRDYRQMLSWGEVFHNANTETKHMIMAQLIERVDIGSGYKINIKFRMSALQFLGEAV